MGSRELELTYSMVPFVSRGRSREETGAGREPFEGDSSR